MTAESLISLKQAYRSTGKRFLPEDSPFTTLFADITHRCNMSCRNCYIPVRDLPDLPVDWLYAIIARLPRRTRIRLVGAEPTMREDLPEIISRVRALNHIPVILSNGLKLGRLAYVQELKRAGLRTVYLSLNGGLRDELYLAIDDLACAKRKLQALDNLVAENMNITAGIIVVPGVNETHLAEFLPYLAERGVRDIHLRTVGVLGRHMPQASMDMNGLERTLFAALDDGQGPPVLQRVERSAYHRDYHRDRAKFQLTVWPDLGSYERGRITPEGYVEQMFESMQANEFAY